MTSTCDLQACAPRYTYYYSKFDKKEPVGTCYYATDGFNTIKEFSPCRRERKHPLPYRSVHIL